MTPRRCDVAGLDREIRAASLNLRAWAAGKNPSCDPVALTELMDRLLLERFQATHPDGAHPDDVASVVEWGMGG